MSRMRGRMPVGMKRQSCAALSSSGSASTILLPDVLRHSELLRLRMQNHPSPAYSKVPLLVSALVVLVKYDFRAVVHRPVQYVERLV